jgi:hypothetical protein
MITLVETMVVDKPVIQVSSPAVSRPIAANCQTG